MSLSSIRVYLFSFILLLGLCFFYHGKSRANQEVLPSIYELLFSTCHEDSFPPQFGRWPSPKNVFTLPPKNDGQGYYYKDIQASFPGVNWQRIDRLYIPAGNYKYIYLGNLPERSQCNPLIISNSGGQVKVGGFDHHYLFLLQGGKNWVLTGRYDPLSQTGHPDYPGHWGGNYSNSRDRYGFLIDDDYIRSGNSGLGIGGKASDFEVEFVEIREVGFAGMLVKTDNDGTATMANIRIHDTYIHDTLSEGYYIGSTQSEPQHQIKNLELYNNRVVRSGTEAIQLGQLGGNVKIFNNVFALSAVHWKDAFQNYQDGNLQIGNRTGDLRVENNIFIGAAGNIAFCSAQDRDGDTYPVRSTVLFRNNYFSSSRNLFFYLRNDGIPGLHYQFSKNYFTHWDFQRTEITPSATVPEEMIRSFTPVPVLFENNVWMSETTFCNKLNSGNGTNDNYTGYGNRKEAPPLLRFMDSGLGDDFDYLKVEVWAATAGRGGDAPISYELDDIAMYLGIPYTCKVASCSPGLIPPDNPAIWQERPFFTDDWRLKSATGLDNLGLMY